MAQSFADALNEAKVDEAVQTAMLRVSGAEPDDSLTELGDVSAEDIRRDLEGAATTFTLKQKGMVQRFIAAVLRSLGKHETRKRPGGALPVQAPAKRPVSTGAAPRRDLVPPGAFPRRPSVPAPPAPPPKAKAKGAFQRIAAPVKAQHEDRTTLIIKNLPQAYGRESLAELLESEDFGGCYDLIYLPHSFETQLPFGYGFVNLVSPEEASRCVATLGGISLLGFEDEAPLDVGYAEAQGLEAHIERYRSSPVMHESVPDELRPALYRDGVRVPFPPPLREVKPPRMRKQRAAGQEGLHSGR